MPKTEKVRNKIIMIVEGSTDRHYLEPIRKVYEEQGKEVFFAWAHERDVKQYGGDLTSKFGINEENIFGVMNKIIINPLLKRHKLSAHQIEEVIFFVDIDGCFIPDENVYYSEGVKGIHYSVFGLYTGNVERTLDRNHRKAANIQKLMSTDSIKLNKYDAVPFSVYYSAVNLDTLMTYSSNAVLEEKIRACTNMTDEEFYMRVKSAAPIVKGDPYQATWSFISKGLNSCKRFSNIKVLIDKIRATALEVYC